jgi:hypothetical protein
MNEHQSIPARAEKIFALPNRESSTAQQVNTLLSIFQHTGQFLMGAAANEMEAIKGGQIDGGAKIAAEQTFAQVCAKLDTILADPDRWTLSTQTTMEKALTEAYGENAKMLHEQAEAYRRTGLPQARYTPALFHLPAGPWVAVLGDPKNLEGSVVGMGDSPQEALDAFDSQFNGKLPANLERLVKEHNEKYKLDGETGRGTETDAAAEEEPEGNGERPGEDGLRGGEEAGPAKPA